MSGCKHLGVQRQCRVVQNNFKSVFIVLIYHVPKKITFNCFGLVLEYNSEKHHIKLALLHYIVLLIGTISVPLLGTIILFTYITQLKQ